MRNLKVQLIIVLGHAQCGGIRALLDGGVSSEDSFIAEWMGIADDAREMVNEKYTEADSATRLRAWEQQAILVSLDNLKTFSWIREGVESNCLTLHGWYFDIECGELLGYNPKNVEFEML
ncbi:MAG: carbonic anhydrase [Gallionella sp.]